MEIRTGIIASNQYPTPITKCSVCDNDFQPADDMDFVCYSCKSKLHCPCQYDDVVIDWGVETDGDFPYFWIIECVCGKEKKSRLHGLADVDIVAKELFAEWTTN